MIFGSQISERAWAYLGELRQTMDRIKNQDWDTNLEAVLSVEVAHTFLLDLRFLHHLLVYSANLLGTEFKQVFDTLDPILHYTETWQRTEKGSHKLLPDCSQVNAPVNLTNLSPVGIRGIFYTNANTR